MTCVHFNVPFTPSNHINQVLTLCDAFRDLIPFVQFEKREKDPWRSVTFYKVAGCLQFSKSNTPSCFFFSRFSNCTDRTKMCKASHIYLPAVG